MKLRRRFALRIFFFVLLLILVSSPVKAPATEKIWQIGFLSPAIRDSFHDPFLKGLREVGYIEGRNFILHSRLAAATQRRLTEAAVELAKLRVDVIVARGTQATLAAKKATATIPIIMTGSSDPVGTGLVASLARPGANVTGMSIVAPDLAEKRLELLKRVVSGSRVGVLWNPTNAGNVIEWEQSKAAANRLKMTLISREVRQPKDINRAFKSLKPRAIDAVATLTDALLSTGRTDIVHFAANSRLAGIFHLIDFVEEGGLMSYGPDLHHSFYRAAYYVDRVLKGANPASLPVEQPTKFEFGINLQTAKQIGVMIPTDVLALADRVIK
jgi:putative tryptophan/tyrosine transport system substrate-binding protein